MRCYCPRLQDTCGVAGEWSEEGLEGGSVAVGASGEVWRCEEVMGVAPVVVMCVARGWEGWRMCVRRSVRTVEPLLAAEEKGEVELRFAGDGDVNGDEDDGDRDIDVSDVRDIDVSDVKDIDSVKDIDGDMKGARDIESKDTNMKHINVKNSDDVSDETKDDMKGDRHTENNKHTHDHNSHTEHHKESNEQNTETTTPSLQPCLHMRCADGWHRFYWILYPSMQDYHVTTIHSFSLHRSDAAQRPIQLGWFYVNHLETHARMLQCDCTHVIVFSRRFAAKRAHRRASRTLRDEQAAGAAMRAWRTALGLREKGPHSAGGSGACGRFLESLRGRETGGKDADYELLS